MRKTTRTTRLTTWILIASALAFAAGCGGGAKRPWSGEESVLTFTDAVWVELAPTRTGERRIVLVSATWRPEKGLTIEDVQYLFRGGIVLTPGFGAKVLETFEEAKP